MGVEMKNFKSEDGYLFHQKRDEAGKCWTDGDLYFEDENDWPIDNMGNKVSGRLLPDSIAPLTPANLKDFRDRLASQLFKCGFKEGPDHILQRGHINVSFRDELAVKVDLSDDGWYGSFQSYYYNIDAVRLVNIANDVKDELWNQ